jgi:hypothetical protein
MSNPPTRKRQITAAERGNIIQHVLVDGWSAAQAAAAFGVEERRIAGWLAAYRRYGMASLRGGAAVESAPRRWLWLLRMLGARFAGPPGRGREGQTTRGDQRSHRY